MAPTSRCAVCGREEETTRHHLTPRCLHRRLKRRGKADAESLRETIEVCPPCHKRIHQLFSEKELGQSFASLDRILAHEAIRAWIGWIAKRPRGFRPRTSSWKSWRGE